MGYLHDWSLPRKCPQVFGPPPYKNFVVPRYFAGDYFQRAAFDGYQSTWPSLFVGSNETESKTHVDSGGTSFFMYLLGGRKEWRFFSRRDIVNVYEDPIGAHFHVDIFSQDAQKFPLVKYAEQYFATQNAGDLIFIPGDTPHAVMNSDHILAVSMNYVDAGNVWIYVWRMILQRAWPAVETFTDNFSFPHGLRSGQ